jgi:hypothetical protein
LIADCSTDPVGSSGAVHTLTIDSYRGSKTLWGTNAKVTIPDPDPQVGIEFDENGTGTSTVTRSMGDIIGKSNPETVAVRRRSAGNTAGRSIQTLVSWYISPNQPQQVNGVNPQQHRCCVYTVSVT